MSDDAGRITSSVLWYCEGLQVLSSRSQSPLGALINPPTLQVVHDLTTRQREEKSLCIQPLTSMK
jgi:hypothetical protein